MAYLAYLLSTKSEHMNKSVLVEETIFTHEYLWRSSTTLFNQAKSHPENSQHYLIPSLLMSFLAFEAFVNFCGEILAPEKWANERDNFRSKGLNGKLEEIFKKIPEFVWEKDQPPYKDIKNIENFRHMAAHGKVIKSKYSAVQKEDGSHFEFTHPWDEFISEEAVTSGRRSIENFCNSILNEARKITDEPHFIFPAFSGSLASGMSSEIF